jgi:hypothetical protein
MDQVAEIQCLVAVAVAQEALADRQVVMEALPVELELRLQ